VLEGTKEDENYQVEDIDIFTGREEILAKETW